MKRLGVALTGLLAALYLINPTAGFFELLPDNIPFLGNLDEATATMILIAVLRYFGIDLTRFFNARLDPVSKDRNSKNPR
jgi:hypothetical protein